MFPILTTWNQEYQLILDHQKHVLQAAFKVWVDKSDVSIDRVYWDGPKLTARAVVTGRQVSFEKPKGEVLRNLEERLAKCPKGKEGQGNGQMQYFG